MFVILAILLGMIIGFIRKGTVSNLFKPMPKLWFLGVIGLLIQLGLHLLFYTSINSAFLSIINLVSYLMIIATLIFNLKNFWAIMMIVGFTVNFLVIFINGGLMPVSSDVLGGASTALAASITNGSNAVYTLLDQTATRLWFLGDAIRIPGVGAITSLYGFVPSFSIGTLVILIGLTGCIQHKMAASKMSKNAVFGDEDALLGASDYPLPDQGRASEFKNQDEEDDAAFFKMGDAVLNDKKPIDDSFFTDDTGYLEEEALTDLTEYIPRLTPEMIEEIRRNSLDDSDALMQSDSTETRVFTAIRDLNEQKEEKVSEEISLEEDSKFELFESETTEAASESIENWWEDEQQDDKTMMPKWDWNPKSSIRVTEEPVFEEDFSKDVETVSTSKDEGDQMEVTEERKKSEWNPLGVERNTYAESRLTSRNQKNNPYSTLYNRSEKKAQRGRSSDEMRNIWHQASVDDNKRRKVHFNAEEDAQVNTVPNEPAGNLETAGSPGMTPVLQNQSVQTEIPEYEQARDVIAKKWDQKNRASQLISLTPNNSTERVDSKEVLRKSLTEKDEQKTADAVTAMEREKAGYEKVELEIDGRTVSFWRKKKS